jgi:glycine/D-amino acid oxidase-like deaminating enzyme
MPSAPKLNDDYERRAYWHATMPPLPDRSGKPLPEVVDVVVVGGGYTGVAAARKLALEGATVALLEANSLGWGASTRNGGIAHPGFKWGPRTLTKKYGDTLARAIYNESVAATDLVRSLITENGIDAELRWNGYLELAWAKSHDEDFAAEAASIVDFGTSARAVPKTQLRSEIGTDAYHGGMAVDGGGLLHPAKWFVGLVGLAEKAGADLHERVRARSIGRQADGRFVVESDRGAILASNVLVATNGYTDGVAPSLRRRIIPIGSYIIATEQLPEDLARELAPTGRAFFDTKNFLSYWHVSQDRRMLFGGRVSFLPTTVDRTARLLYPRMLEIHPQLAGYRIEYSWGGKVAITMDRMPHIGQMGGITYSMGYSGTGVVLSTYMGTRAAEWLGGGEAPALSKVKFPLVPAPFEGRPWFLPVVGEFFRAVDRLAVVKGGSGTSVGKAKTASDS